MRDKERANEREREKRRPQDNRIPLKLGEMGPPSFFFFFFASSSLSNIFFLPSFSSSFLRTRGERISSENKIKKNRKAWTINTFRFYVCVCIYFKTFRRWMETWKKKYERKEKKGTKSFFLYTLFLCGSWLNQLYLYFIKFYLDEKSVRVPSLVAGRLAPAQTSSHRYTIIQPMQV